MDSCATYFYCIELSSYFQNTWDLWKKKNGMIGLDGWVDEKDSKIYIYVDFEERLEGPKMDDKLGGLEGEIEGK